MTRDKQQDTHEGNENVNWMALLSPLPSVRNFFITIPINKESKKFSQTHQFREIIPEALSPSTYLPLPSTPPSAES